MISPVAGPWLRATECPWRFFVACTAVVILASFDISDARWASREDMLDGGDGRRARRFLFTPFELLLWLIVLRFEWLAAQVPYISADAHGNAIIVDSDCLDAYATRHYALYAPGRQGASAVITCE